MFLLFTKAPERIDAAQYSIRKKEFDVMFYNQSNVFCECLPKVCLHAVVMSGLIPHTRYKRAGHSSKRVCVFSRSLWSGGALKPR